MGDAGKRGIMLEAMSALTLLLAGGSWFGERRQHVLYFAGAAQGLQHAVGKIAGGGRRFGNGQTTAVVHQHAVGEGATDVDADAQRCRHEGIIT